MTTWNETKEQTLKTLRAAYLEEVGRLAESLRPRFESGELHGYNTSDEESAEDARGGPPPRPAMDELLDLSATWFGLQEGGREDRYEEVSRTASLIRAVAPGDALTSDDQALVGEAIMAIYYDLLAVARARGWYTITPGEWPEAKDTAWATAELAPGRPAWDRSPDLAAAVAAAKREAHFILAVLADPEITPELLASAANRTRQSMNELWTMAGCHVRRHRGAGAA